MEKMKISKNGVDFIKKFEGCRLEAYKPVPTEKYWTIGYGHYGSDVKKSSVITKADAEQLLVFDLRVFEYGVNSLVEVKLNQNQFDALVSFAYNCGRENLRLSTLLKKVNQGDFKEAANEFEKWVNAGGKKLNGLVRRRKEEKDLFLTPVKEIVKAPVKEVVKTPSTQKYTIRSGESLSKIAKREKTTVAALMKLNPQIRNKNLVYAGQQIKIPKQ
jgi:GH24 family phage-related lysozyme (muramidase)